jgi:DNA-binding YbaB/EbfC family protein
MFDMLKGLGQVASLLRNPGKVKEEMAQLHARLAQVVAEGDAGAGMVKVRFNGHSEMIGCTLSDEILKMNDREMLEDLIKAAVNQGLMRAREISAEETAKMTSQLGLSLPPGVKLPGMS